MLSHQIMMELWVFQLLSLTSIAQNNLKYLALLTEEMNME